MALLCWQNLIGQLMGWFTIPSFARTIRVLAGTIGEKLDNNPDLFLSQDGGVTWIMVRASLPGEGNGVHSLVQMLCTCVHV